jgi:GNAT superfamily N-acetyltransferase
MGKVLTGVAEGVRREACYRLGYEVFCEEMGTLHDVADHDTRMLRDEVIQGAEVLYAEVDGEVVGSLGVLCGADSFPAEFESGFDIARYASVVPRDRMAVNIRFLVKESHRSSMVPFALILEASRLQHERGVMLSFCDCQAHLLNLYQAIGFRPCAAPFDQAGFGMMVPLVMITGDLDHLRSIRTPLLEHFDDVQIESDYVADVLELLPTERYVTALDSLDEVSWSEAYEALSRGGSDAGVFEDLSTEEVQQLLTAGQLIECSRGQLIVGETQGTRTVFVVLDGEVEIRSRGQTVGVLGKGQPFGEIAFLLQSRRTADVVAATDRVRVIALSERVLQGLIRSQSELTAKFLLNLSKTLALKVMGRSVLVVSDRYQESP